MKAAGSQMTMADFEDLDLDSLRIFGAKILVALMAAFVPITFLVGFFDNSPYLILGTLIAIGAVALPAINHFKGNYGPTARLNLGISAPLTPAAMLCVTAGQPWQIDMHMLFFAFLATLVILADWRPILAATLVTAVHHLALNFIAPALVFGGDGNLFRVMLHAVIVLIESGVLLWTANALVKILEKAEETAEEANAARAKIIEEGGARSEVIGVLQHGMGQLADGDLTVSLDEPFAPEFEPLRLNFNRSVARTKDTVSALVGSVETMEGIVRDISGAAGDLAARTEEEAATITEISRSTTGTTEAAEAVANRATEGKQLFAKTVTEAKASRAVVDQAKDAMFAISSSSSEIGEIVAIIESIAFQTTLLSLNASVEAARSGEAGRGFAVVASEIRALADKVAGSVAEIREKIDRGVGETDNGVALVDQAGNAMEKLTDHFDKIDEIIGDISNSVDGQRLSLGEINSGIGAMSEVTNANADIAQQSNSAAQSLVEAMDGIRTQIARFKVSEADHSHHPAVDNFSEDEFDEFSQAQAA